MSVEISHHSIVTIHSVDVCITAILSIILDFSTCVGEVVQLRGCICDVISCRRLDMRVTFLSGYHFSFIYESRLCSFAF